MAKADDDSSGLYSMLRPRNVFVLASVVASMSNFLFGYELGVISKAVSLMEGDFIAVRNNSFLQDIILYIAVFGIILGYLAGRRLNANYGLRKTILAADVISALGAVLMATATNPHILPFGRVLTHFGVGLATVTSPFYIGETQPKEVSSGFMATHTLMFIAGQLFSFLIKFSLNEVSGAWRWMLLISGIPAFLQFCSMLYMPESPNWVAKKKLRSMEEATKDSPTF